MLDQNVPNPLAKNPKFNTHKVFSTIGLILIFGIIIVSGIWYYVQGVENKAPNSDDANIKVSTPSAKTKTSTSSVTNSNPLAQSRDVKRRTDLQQLKSAMQLFYNDCKTYPQSLPSKTWSGKSININCDNSGTIYLKVVPQDPDGTDYGYLASPKNCTKSCQNFAAGAVLESPTIEDQQTLIVCPDLVKTLSGKTTNYRVCND